MGHNDGIQAPSNPVHILKRGARYYYQKRIPLELVRAGCYGKQEIIKRSLGTGDRALAKRLALTVALEIDEDFEAKRRELRQASAFANSAKSGGTLAKRRLSDLSEIERRDFIVRAFIAREKEETGCRSWESDLATRETKLESAREDLAALAGSPHFQEADWLAMTRKAMEGEGISTDGEEEAKVRAVADMLRRAVVESAWRTERAILGSPYEARDSYFDGWHADSPMPAPAKANKTIGDLCLCYLADVRERESSGNLAHSTIKWKEQSAKVLVDFFGESVPLRSITKDEALRLALFLPTIPSNAAKRFPNASIVVAAEFEAKKEDKKLISPKTVRYYYEGISNIFKFARDDEWLSTNPLDRQSVRERLPKVEEEDARPLTPDEMTKVLASPDFLAQKQAGEQTVEARYWLPLLCLFHGTRANEIAGIRLADVKEDDGIPWFNLRNTEDRRIKTESSKRRVPLHPALVEFGFLKFVADRRGLDPEGFLFSGLNRNKNGSMADAVCKWWARLVIRLLGPAESDWPKGSRGIHSLRHSWVAAARAAGIPEDIWERITGHSEGGKVSRRYGRFDELPLLKKTVNKIEFPKVDFSALLSPNAVQ